LTAIDLNTDVGEGLDEVDRELLEVITSANVACGFHAGGEASARPLCAAAAARGVAVGAHVGYRDREGFGRRELGIPAAKVEAETREQIAALREWGGHVTYVKPHGALYHRMQREAECADAIVRAADGLPVLGLDVVEGFADRGYAPDGLLVPRDEPGALLDEEEAVAQALRLAHEGSVRSICLHGDSPGAVALGRRLRAALEADGINLRAFA
jgi:5-oxoprolinase (ATP-hydrolysing) subunit A